MYVTLCDCPVQVILCFHPYDGLSNSINRVGEMNKGSQGII